MPSLIGNKINQVPTNGDLGTLAFQDSNAVNITGGVVDVSAGTAALPTLGTTGDPNTGVFFPAADTVAIATNGVERVRVDSSGNVGVGTNSPAAKLQVNSINPDAQTTGTLIIQKPDFVSGSARHVAFQIKNPTFANNFDIGLATNAGGFANAFINIPNASQGLTFEMSGTERMRIDSAGNVGIGTAAPNNRLQIQAGNFANVAAAITQGSGTTGNASQLLLQDGSFTLGAVTGYGSAYGASLNSATMVSSNTVVTTGSSANYSSSNFATRYTQVSGTHQWATAPSGTAGNAITFTESMRIDTNGNLLVGTTSTAGVASNSKVITNGGVLTSTGNVSAATATATTIFSITGANRGRYEIVALIANSGVPNGYTSIATVIWDGDGGRIIANNGTNLTITLSTTNVQITQISGSTQTVYWSFQRIALF
jgi:hypothetical protein